MGQIPEPLPPPLPQPVVKKKPVEVQVESAPSSITQEDYSPSTKRKVDWRLIWLELFTLLLVGGLIPFWLFIWFKLSTTIR